MSNRIEVDVVTGIVRTVANSAAEDALAAAATASENSARNTAAANQKLVDNFDKSLKAVALWVAQINGKNIAQARAEIKAILDTL